MSDQTAVAEAGKQGGSTLSPEKYRAFVRILEDELIPAMGCTEPIAVAYASAVAEDTLGEVPVSCTAIVSGNIVKNVNSVVVPNTGGMRGLPASVAAGVVSGHAEAKLEVLASIKEADREKIVEYLARTPIQIELAETDEPFYVEIVVTGASGSTARVVMEKDHTHISLVEKDGQVVRSQPVTRIEAELGNILDLFTVQDIVDFADCVDLDEVREFLGRQVDYNYAIAQEGLTNDWGAQIGKTYMSMYDSSNVLIRAKAAAAAGSDARMNGCPMPVVIVSGSGNQGIAASVPLVVYAEEYGKTRDELLRALVVSDLVAIYQKLGIGCLSAYCGAICAGTGAAAGIVYLLGGRFEEIEHTIVNSLGIISGMVCDGAKSSCAAKIALSFDSGMLGARMYANGNQFRNGDGIVGCSVDRTVANVSRMAREGMRATDREILSIMIGK